MYTYLGADIELFKQYPNLTPRRHHKFSQPAVYKGKPHMPSCQF